jgi:hypothetical protein
MHGYTLRKEHSKQILFSHGVFKSFHLFEQWRRVLVVQKAADLTTLEVVPDYLSMSLVVALALVFRVVESPNRYEVVEFVFFWAAVMIKWVVGMLVQWPKLGYVDEVQSHWAPVTEISILWV